jgi:hypothetical protein
LARDASQWSGDITMGAELALTALLQLGLRITSSRDLDQARWLVRQAGVDAVRKATHELASRYMPRPQRVILYLGLDRRTTPRPDLPHAAAAQAHTRNRQLGWHREAASTGR